MHSPLIVRTSTPEMITTTVLLAPGSVFYIAAFLKPHCVRPLRFPVDPGRSLWSGGPDRSQIIKALLMHTGPLSHLCLARQSCSEPSQYMVGSDTGNDSQRVIRIAILVFYTFFATHNQPRLARSRMNPDADVETRIRHWSLSISYMTVLSVWTDKGSQYY